MVEEDSEQTGVWQIGEVSWRDGLRCAILAALKLESLRVVKLGTSWNHPTDLAEGMP